MRDWLACPLSPTTSLHTKSDEGTTTDDDYAFVNTESGSELEISEVELEEDDGEEETSTWLSVLSIFGVAKKLSRKKPESRSSSSSSLYTATPIENVIVKEEEEKDGCLDSTEKVKHEHEDEGVHLYQIPLDDQSCNNSIASTIDSDISTQVPSQMNDLTKIIMPSSSSSLPRVKTVKVCWNYGGKKVQITGEFDHWSKPIDMIPDKEGGTHHHIDLPLSLNKDIEFKFMVDGEWRYAADLPHRTDKNGNVNNVIYKDTVT